MFKTDAAYNRERLILYRFGNLVRLIILGGFYFGLYGIWSFLKRILHSEVVGKGEKTVFHAFGIWMCNYKNNSVMLISRISNHQVTSPQQILNIYRFLAALIEINMSRLINYLPRILHRNYR